MSNSLNFTFNPTGQFLIKEHHTTAQADLEDVAVGTEKIENMVTVEFALSESIDHQHRACARHGRCTNNIVLP